MPSEFQLNIESKIDSDSTKEAEDTSSSPSSSVALSEKENTEKIILTTSNQKSANTGNESQKKEKINPSIGSRPRKDSANEGKYTGYNHTQRDAPRSENKTEEDVKQQQNPLQESRRKKGEGVGA
jgi:hypothetical protein